MKKLILIVATLIFTTKAYAQECPAPRVVVGTLVSDLTTTNSTAVIAAQTWRGASVKTKLFRVLVTNSSATASVAKVLDNASTVMRFLVPAGGGVYFDLDDTPVLPAAAGTAWNIQMETGVSGIQATFVGCTQ